MLKTVELSRAQKTKGIAVTYRAGTKNNFGTCPATCELNPSGCGASKIDLDYLDAISDAVPVKGQSFTYSHFSPIYWAKKLKLGKTVINYSAKTAELAARYVTAMPFVFWARLSSTVFNIVHSPICDLSHIIGIKKPACKAGLIF